MTPTKRTQICCGDEIWGASDSLSLFWYSNHLWNFPESNWEIFWVGGKDFTPTQALENCPRSIIGRNPNRVLFHFTPYLHSISQIEYLEECCHLISLKTQSQVFVMNHPQLLFPPKTEEFATIGHWNKALLNLQSKNFYLIDMDYAFSSYRLKQELNPNCQLSLGEKQNLTWLGKMGWTDTLNKILKY